MDFLLEIIDSFEHWLLAFSSDVYDFLGWGGVVLLMALESTAFPLPSEIVMPLAGWRLILDEGLAVSWVWLAGFWGGVGSVLGSLAEYWVARIGGRPFLERYGKFFLLTRKDLDRVDRWFTKRGEITILVGRLVPVVRHLISIPAGIARMNIWRFVLFTFIGSFPWCVLMAWAGYELGSRYDEIREFTRPATIPIVLLIGAAGLWLVWHRVSEIRREGRELVAEAADGGDLDSARLMDSRETDAEAPGDDYADADAERT